jgi:2-keto-4-pentenoate hydratase
MTTASIDVERLAADLLVAERTRRPIAPLTEAAPALTLEEAYAVQRAAIARRLAAGALHVGWKIGLTSRAMQELLGVDQPDFGHLLDEMELAPGAPLALGELVAPRIEPEIAFMLGRDLRGPGVTIDDALVATRWVAPSLEVVDSRIADWRIRLADTVADNASSGRYLLGERRVPAEALDLSSIELHFTVGDEPPVTATGEAVLGHPAAPVAWLANTLAPLGEALHAGQVVMSGSFVAAVPLVPGVRYLATLPALGSVELTAV